MIANTLTFGNRVLRKQRIDDGTTVRSESKGIGEVVARPMTMSDDQRHTSDADVSLLANMQFCVTGALVPSKSVIVPDERHGSRTFIR